eukprot:235635-Prorocentrum_minimum.AAC.1
MEAMATFPDDFPAAFARSDIALVGTLEGVADVRARCSGFFRRALTVHSYSPPPRRADVVVTCSVLV